MSERDQDNSPSNMGGTPATVVAGCVLLALVPFFALCWKVWKCGLYFPYWDAWHFALFLEKASGEGVGFGDFWAQHNEHRLLFPRLLMLSLAKLSGWNVAWELVTNLCLGLGTCLLLCRMVYRSPHTRSYAWYSLPIFSFLVFSWVQMENWVWGWQLQVFLSTAAVVAGASILTGHTLNPWRFLLALCLGIIASFSFANGQIYWIAMAPLVFLAPSLSKETRLIYSLLWVAAGVLVIQLYLLDYTKPSVSPSIGAVFQSPIQFLGYVIVYVGAPITGIFTRPAWHGVGLPLGAGHFLAGTLGLGALPLFTVLILRRNRQEYPSLLPWAGLALYVLGSATITAAGRAAMGLEQATTSRYTTIGTLYWCALAATIFIYLQGQSGTLSPPRRTKWLLGGLGLACFFGGLLLSHQSQRAWEQNVHWKRMGWTALRAGHLSPLYLQDLCWDPLELRDQFLPILRENQWAGMGSAPFKPTAMAGRYVADAEQFIAMGLIPQAKVYLETALYLDPEHAGALTVAENLKTR